MEEIPEFYSDAIDITLTMPWTVTITYSLRSTEEGRDPKPISRIRMSPEHAKVTAMILRRSLKKYEEASKSSINLPEELYSQLELSPEDW